MVLLKRAIESFWFKGRSKPEDLIVINLHLHHARNVMGWALGIVAFSPFALCIDLPSPNPTTNTSLSDVTGRVTYSGHPLNEVTICLDRGGVHSAFGALDSAGSFQLLNMNEGCPGAYRGHYQAHLYRHPEGPRLPEKYGKPETSGVEIDIDTDWSDLYIDLN
jgi:hypothetical protein